MRSAIPKQDIESGSVLTLSIRTLKGSSTPPTFSNLRPKTQAEVTKIIEAQATFFKNRVELWVPNEPITKIEDGYELSQGHINLKGKEISEIEKLRKELFGAERSIRRSKRNLSILAEYNDFDWFVTFTFKTDRHDAEKCRKQLENHLKNVKKRKGRFRYILIQERHKKCAACAKAKIPCPHPDEIKPIHFHGLFGGYPGNPVPAINKNTGGFVYTKGKVKRQIYNFPEFTLGHQSHSKIADRTAVSRYILKYIKKEMVTAAPGKKRYWASRNLKFPEIVENPIWCNKFVQNCTGEQIWKNDFGSKYTLTTEEFSLLFQ